MRPAQLVSMFKEALTLMGYKRCYIGGNRLAALSVHLVQITEHTPQYFPVSNRTRQTGEGDSLKKGETTDTKACSFSRYNKWTNE